MEPRPTDSDSAPGADTSTGHRWLQTDRAVAWRYARHAEICDVVRPWAHGTVVRCTSMPDWWDYNSVRVEGRDPGVDAETLIRTADEFLDELDHRQIEVEDQAAGERLRPAFEERGWSVERLAWLERTGPPADGEDFPEVPFVDTRELRIEWMRSLPWMNDEDAITRFIAHEDAVADMRGTRTLVARDEAGVPVGYVSFVAQGDTAEVEQAYVTPALRSRGLGGALVAAAVRAADAHDAFIIADDEGDSKRLYERLGFATVWIEHVFLRRPG
jgi:GNAT superfamily N-acetyltransferase